MLGATRDHVDVGADFGVTDRLEDLVEQVGTALDQGFPRVKLKYRPGWDLPVVRAVRDAFPRATLHIDCNSGYTLDDLAMFQSLDELELASRSESAPDRAAVGQIKGSRVAA